MIKDITTNQHFGKIGEEELDRDSLSTKGFKPP